MAVLNFFPVQKFIFGHFWNCKKWNLVKKKLVKLIYLISQVFSAWTFFKFSGLLCVCSRISHYSIQIWILLWGKLKVVVSKGFDAYKTFTEKNRIKNFVESRQKKSEKNYILDWPKKVDRAVATCTSTIFFFTIFFAISRISEFLFPDFFQWKEIQF